MVANNTPPLFSVPVVDPARNSVVTQYWRDFFTRIWESTRALGIGGPWTTPVGAGTRAAFDMNVAYLVSNPPTQGEVQAIAGGLVEVRKRLGQLIIDQQDAGTIS